MLKKSDEPVSGYRLAKYLGRGQFGEVWECSAPGGTSAALKFVNLEHAGGLTEYRSIQRIKEVRHPHLMPITALWLLDENDRPISDDETLRDQANTGTVSGTLQPEMYQGPKAQPKMLILAMLRADMHLGDRLKQCQEQGQTGIPAEELLRYMEEAAKGIDFLNEHRHDLGEGPIAIQHCDIKPANILLLGGSVMIADFGIARILTDVQATATSMTGTPAYMSPESIRRRPGRWTDQYSLAISYVELRTGKLPFKDMETLAVLEANRDGNLELSGLPPAEQEVIGRATSVVPEERFPSTQAMVEALRAAIENEPSIITGSKANSKTVALWSVPILLLCALAVYLIVQRPWEQPSKPATAVADNDRPGASSQDIVPPKGTDPDSSTGNGADTASTDDTAATDAATSTGGEPTTPSPVRLTFRLDPADSVISIDEQLQTPNPQGEISIDMLPDQSVRIAARHPSGDYEPIDDVYTAKTLEDLDFTLRLNHTAEYHLNAAKRALGAGDREAASQAFRAAVEIDASLLNPVPLELAKQNSPINQLAVTKRWVISCSDAGKIGFWKTESIDTSPEPVSLVDAHGGEPIEALTIADDESIAITGGWDGQVRVWDLSANDPGADPRPLVGHTSDVVDVAVHRPSKRIVTAALDETIRVWTLTETGPLRTEFVLTIESDDVEGVDVSDDGRWLVAAMVSGRVVRWDLAATDVENSLEELLPEGQRVGVATVSADSRWLIAGDDGGRLSLIDLQNTNAKPIQTPTSGHMTALAAAASGSPILSGSSNGTVRRWQQDAKALSPTTVGVHAGVVARVAVSRSGEFAASAGWDGNAYYWDFGRPDSSQSPMLLRGDGQELLNVTFSPDDRWLVVAGKGGKIWLWQINHCRLAMQHEDFVPQSVRPAGKIEARHRPGLLHLATVSE